MASYTEIQNQLDEVTKKILDTRSAIETRKSYAASEYVRMIDWVGAVRSTAKNSWSFTDSYIAPETISSGNVESKFITSNSIDYRYIPGVIGNDSACGNNRPNCSNAVSTYNSSRSTFIGHLNYIITLKSQLKSYEDQANTLQKSLESNPDYKIQIEKDKSSIEAEEKKHRNTLIFIGFAVLVIVVGVIVAKKLKLF